MLNGLTANNAVCLLSQARLFEEEILLQRCFEMIDKHTDIALAPESKFILFYIFLWFYIFLDVTDIDRTTLIEVLGRSHLDPTSELVVFRAAQSWAEAECERRELAPTVENLREVLGSVMKTIRFPLMNVHEFGQAGKILWFFKYELKVGDFLHFRGKNESA